jgi:Domain of unknown function (DUF4350)
MSQAAAKRGTSTWVAPVVAVGGVLLALVAIGAPGESSSEPLDPRSDERLGTSALVALADDLGADVDVVESLPDPDEPGETEVLLMFADLLDDGQRRRLDRWVRAGGTLVVTDPTSQFTPSEGGGFADDFADPGDLPADRVVCDIAPLDGLEVANVDPWLDVGLETFYDVPAGSDSCVGDGEEAYIVATPTGEGAVVAIGGPGMFVNRALGDGENAPVVAALVAPQEGTRLDVLRPGPVVGSGDDTLIDLISPNVWAALVQLTVAFVLYALWRSRRLGAPVAEPQPVAVAGSELVAAVGSLLDRSGSPQHAANLLRADLRRFLGDRLGVPADAPPHVLAAVAAERAGADEARVAWALGPSPVDDDAQLVALAQTIDAVRREVLDHV